MTHFNFQRHQRLLNSADFQSVFDQVDVRVSHSAYLILAHKTEPTQPGRLGFVVSKKNLKRAVDRNQFKRWVRNSFRLHQHDLIGMDIIVLSRKGSGDLGNPEFDQQLQKSWLKLIDRCNKFKPTNG